MRCHVSCTHHFVLGATRRRGQQTTTKQYPITPLDNYATVTITERQRSICGQHVANEHKTSEPYLFFVQKKTSPFLLHYNSISNTEEEWKQKGDTGKAEVLMIKRAQSESYWIHRPIRPRGAYAKSNGVRGNSPICCGVLQARADLSMLWMNSPWPWGSHQFCMRSPHQIDQGLYCSTGSSGFPWGQTPTETAVATQTTYCSLTHTHARTHAELRADNGNSTADQGTLYNYV